MAIVFQVDSSVLADRDSSFRVNESLVADVLLAGRAVTGVAFLATVHAARFAHGWIFSCAFSFFVRVQTLRWMTTVFRTMTPSLAVFALCRALVGFGVPTPFNLQVVHETVLLHEDVERDCAFVEMHSEKRVCLARVVPDEAYADRRDVVAGSVSGR